MWRKERLTVNRVVDVHIRPISVLDEDALLPAVDDPGRPNGHIAAMAGR